MAPSKLLLISLILVGYSYKTQGQGPDLKLSGEVKNSHTNEPLAFAHVKVKNRSIGVPTNSEGKFVLHITEEMIQDTLVVSLIGFSSKSVAIQPLLTEEFYTFLLSQDTTYLEAVVIKAVDVDEVVRGVSKHLKENFPTAPFQFEGYYRNSYREFNKYVRQFETAFSGFDGNFHNRSGHSVKMLKKKESVDYRQFKWRQAQGNIPWHYLWHIRRQHHHFFTNKQYLKYHYNIEKVDHFEGEKVYKIKFVPKDQSDQTRESWAYIRAKDHAILEIGGKASITSPQKFKLSEDLFMSFVGSNVVVKYTEHKGKMYPSYSRSLYKHIVYNAQSVKQGNFDMNEEMIIHEVSTPTEQSSKKQFVGSQEKRITALPTDSIFWSEYNVPVETALSKAILEDLEQWRQSKKE